MNSVIKMRCQKFILVFAGTCVLNLAACSGGGNTPVALGEGMPAAIPTGQNMIAAHASLVSGTDPTLGTSVIQIVDNETVIVALDGESYELRRVDQRNFETADGLASLTFPEDLGFFGQHAGIAAFSPEDGVMDGQQVLMLIGAPDAYDTLPDTGFATFTGGARTYRTMQSGDSFVNNTWEVEVFANFQVGGVGASMTNGQYTLVMDPAGIVDNGDVAYFEDTLTSTDNPDFVVSNGTMAGFFYGEGEEVGGTLSYDVTQFGLPGTVTGVFHAD